SGEHGKDRLRMNAELRTEPAAYKRRQDADVLSPDLQRAGDGGPRPVDNLRADVDLYLLALRDSHAGVRFHGLREMIRRGVGAVEAERSALKGRLEVAPGGIGRHEAIHDFRSIRLVLVRREVELPVLDGIFDVDRIRCGPSLFESCRNHQSD